VMIVALAGAAIATVALLSLPRAATRLPGLPDPHPAPSPIPAPEAVTVNA
jgi:hypothetical protein